MPHRAHVIAAVVVIASTVSVAGTRTLAAQPTVPIAADCNGAQLGRRTESELGELFEQTPDQVWSRLQLQRVGRDFAEMGDTARVVFESLSQGMDAVAKERMTRVLDALQQELIRTDTSATFRTREGPSAVLLEIVERDTSWTIGDSIHVTDRTPVATRRALCWTALLARRIADHGGEAARQQALQYLAGRARRWSNFERSGYSLTPLELLVNGWCGACRGELEPPRTQIILAHILPSYLVRNGGGNRAAITTEVAGLLRYSSSRSFHWGGSVVFAFPQEEKGEIGFMLHVSTLGQLGVTAPLSSFSADNASLLLSADLYRYIARTTGTLRDERDAVRRGAAKVVP